MQITRDFLKQMIQEQMEGQTPGALPAAQQSPQKAKMATGEFRAQEKERALGTQGGITDEERARIHQLGARLQQLAAKKDLAAVGMITTLLKRLEDELNKVQLK